MLEQQITEQEGLIESMRMVMEVAAAEQGTLIHKMNKEIRQHDVDKQDAVEDATKAREDLVYVQKKTATRIKHLERDVVIIAKDKMEMQSILAAQLCGMEESERDLAKQRRILAVKLDDVKKQQDLSESQVCSLAFERANIQTERKKLKRSHSQALQCEQKARERDQKVPRCLAASV